MKVRWSIPLFAWLAVACIVALAPAVYAQEGGPPEDGGMGRGQMMGGGQGVRGTVTAVFPAYLTIKTAEGDSYKVSTGANTRMFKNHEPVKMSDIHVGDMLIAAGEVDSKAKTVGAAFVAVVDAERVRKMREELGKSWISGKVTAINETKISIDRIDGVSQTIVVDENTSFRKRRESITLADIKVGDNVNGRGQLKDGVFVATQLGVGGPGITSLGPGGRHGAGGPGGNQGPPPDAPK